MKLLSKDFKDSSIYEDMELYVFLYNLPSDVYMATQEQLSQIQNLIDVIELNIAISYA